MQKLLSYVRRCVDDYHMIADGDTVAVGVSGGKDSLTTLCALAELSKFYPQHFTVKAISLDAGFGGMDFSPVAALCERLGVEYIVRPVPIKEIVFDLRKEKNPCSLCAKLRRGALNDTAKEAGCMKVALGHHLDDAVETFMLSLLYEGRISCFSPVTYLDRSGITQIRPLLYLHERDIRGFARRYDLPVVHNTCPVNGTTKRQEAKELLTTLSATQKDIRERIFGAMQHYPLKGWGPDAAPRSRKSGPVAIEKDEEQY